MSKAVAKTTGAGAEKKTDLRGTLEWLKSEGDLIESDKEVNPDLEITGIQKQLDGGCPILFSNIKDKPHHRCVTNLFGDMNVINKMFAEKPPPARKRKLPSYITHPTPPVIVDQKSAPAQEEVLEKPKDANEF